MDVLSAGESVTFLRSIGEFPGAEKQSPIPYPPSPTFPPTIILVHPREKAAKCTVECLRGREGFAFHTHPEIPAVPAGYVRLGLGGPWLTEADGAAGLLVLDGTWRLARRMEPFVRHVPVRTLPPWQTAYPRSSKTSPDPSDGLATIEAIFAAYCILGRPTDGLLDDYFWRDRFLELNRPLGALVQTR